MNRLFLLTISTLLCFNAHAQHLGADSVKQRLMTARTYIMVLLEEGENKPADQQAYDQMMFRHLGLLYQLQEEGNILLHGQVLTDSQLTAVLIFNTHDEREAKKAIERSELIQKGYMVYKTFRWFGEPKQFTTINNQR